MNKISILLFLLIGVMQLSATPRITSKKQFFEHLDLNYPGLQRCKKLVEKGAYEQAFAEYTRFYEKRTDRTYYYTPQRFAAQVDRLTKSHPDYIEQVVTRADSLALGIYEIEGETYRWRQGAIPWRAENKEWINVLNRLYCLQDLYVAYYATHESKYLEACIRYMWGWIEENKVPDYPIAFTGGTWEPHKQSYTTPHGPWRALEVGMRLSHMMAAYHAIHQQKAITQERKWMFFSSLMEHVLYIRDYLKRGASGNWESTVASGFASLCVMTPEWICNRQLMEDAKKTINNNLKRAFNPDGFQFELTTGYHKHVVEGYIRTEFLFYQLNGTTCLDEESREMLKKSIDIIARMKKPNGADPVMGDHPVSYNDGSEPHVKDALFVGASLLFPNAGYEQWADFTSPKSILAYGIPEKDNNNREEQPRRTMSSTYLPASQLVIMRASHPKEAAGEGELYLLFDNAIDGAGAHQHHDFLNIELYAYDRTLIIDPGRGSSYNHPLFTSYYRTVRGHNVLQVGDDSKRQERRPQKGSVENLQWITTDEYDAAAGLMKGYEEMDVYRHVFFVKGEYWFVWDKAIGNGNKKLTQRFHLPPGGVGLNPQSKVVDTHAPDAANISVVPFLNGKEAVYVDNGYVYNGKANIWAPVVVIEKKSDLDTPMAVVLYPRKKGATAHPFKTTIETNGSSIDYVLHFGNGRRDVFTVTTGEKAGENHIAYRRIEE